MAISRVSTGNTTTGLRFWAPPIFAPLATSTNTALSARGIAIDTVVFGKTEEFPAFTRFYFESASDNSNAVIVYAFLDGPSITGAYRFVLTREKGVVMDIEANLFLRRDVARFGIAPATSMYWFSGKDKTKQD